MLDTCDSKGSKMKINIAMLISFRDEDEFINGIRFNLTVKMVKSIVEYFRSQAIWTDYYNCEINRYILTQTEVCDLLNLKSKYWSDKELEFSFDLFSGDWEKIGLDYLVNKPIYCLQSKDKINHYDSHFYKCNEDIVKAIIENKIEVNEKLTPEFLLPFSNKHLQFDFSNFDYFLETKPFKEIYIGGKDVDDIATEYSEGYWDDDEL